MADQSKCSKCGAQIQVERRGHLEISHCPKCRTEEYATTFPADEVGDISKPEKVIAPLQWQDGRASTNQVAAVRKLVPTLSNMPLSEIIKASGESPIFELGTYNRSQAVDLVESAARLGLKILLEPVR